MHPSAHTESILQSLFAQILRLVSPLLPLTRANQIPGVTRPNVSQNESKSSMPWKIKQPSISVTKSKTHVRANVPKYNKEIIRIEMPLVQSQIRHCSCMQGQVRLHILFYKRSNHEESFRAVKINPQELSKVNSCVQSTTSESLTVHTMQQSRTKDYRTGYQRSKRKLMQAYLNTNYLNL